MEKFASIFKKEEIYEIYKVVEEYEVWIGHQKIKIKFLIDENNNFHHKLDHHYHGSRQAGPYHSSISMATSLKGAYLNAFSELTAFYDSKDENAIWVKSKSY